MDAAATPSGRPQDTATPSFPHPKEAKWIPTIVVFLVVAFVVVGGYLIAGRPQEIGVTDEAEPGAPVTVAEGVSLTPPAGWVITDRYTDPPGVRLTGGAGHLLVVVPAIEATPEELLQEYVDQVLEPEATQLTVSTERREVSLPFGTAVRTSYVGQFEDVASTLEGELTAAISPTGIDVVFDGWAPQGQYPRIRGLVRRTVAGTEVNA